MRIVGPLAFLSIFLFAVGVSAQQDPDPQLGIRPYDIYNVGSIDKISFTTGSLALDIPLISYPQRGGQLKLDFALHFENHGAFEYKTCHGVQPQQCFWTWVPRPNGVTPQNPGPRLIEPNKDNDQ